MAEKCDHLCTNLTYGFCIVDLGHKGRHRYKNPQPKQDGEQMPTPVKCGYVGCSFTIDVPDFIVSISTKGVEHLTFEIYDHYFEVHDVPRPVEGKKERE